MKKKKIVIASGKGGVGKSMLSSTLTMLFAKKQRVIALDCDVDAPNLAIWLGISSYNKSVSKKRKIIPISVSEKPVIDYKKCNGCGLCAKSCRFSAIDMVNGKPKVNKFLCEGCGLCEIVCPQKAITLKPVQSGEIIIYPQLASKKAKTGYFLIAGNLFPGETGSGKIIAELKKMADEFNYPLQILDSSPGTGCPVTAALQDSDFSVLVTEPTPSAFSDVQRVLKVVNHFKIPYGVVINKWDINPTVSKKIEKWAGKNLLGKITYDKEIFKAVSSFTPILETNLKAKEEIEKIFKKINITFKKL